MYINPKVSLHLGVHKTATTYIQSRLWNSLQELESHKINYIELGELRKCLTSKLREETFGKQEVFDSLYPFLNCERLILSDENILGGTFFKEKESFYPWVKGRVNKILNGLEGCDVDIYITLRNFPNYLISYYSELLRHNDFMTFEDYVSKVKGYAISWLPLLDDLASVATGNIYVNDFRYVIGGDEYFHNLIGKKVNLSDASKGELIRRSKISQENYDLLKFYSKVHSDKSTSKLMDLIDESPQGTSSSEFQPFDDKKYNELSANYEEELSIIANDPRFSFLGAVIEKK